MKTDPRRPPAFPSGPYHSRPCGPRRAVAGVSPPEESGAPELDALERFVEELKAAFGLDGWEISVEIGTNVLDDRGRLAWAAIRVVNSTTARIVVRDAQRPPRGWTPDEAHVLVHLESARALARLANPKATAEELDAAIAKLLDGALARGRAATPRRAALPSGPYFHARFCGPRAATIGGSNGPSLVEQLVDHWQRALRVQEWRITVDVKPDVRDAEGRPTWVRLAAESDSKTGRLTVRDPARAAGVSAGEAYARLRAGIVRALVSLYFTSFGDRNPKATGEAIEAFTKALLDAPTSPPATRGTPNRRRSTT